MNPRMLILPLCAWLLPAAAQADYYDGWRAHDAGDYAKAALEWRKAARSGDVRSQFRLGELYERGRGVAKDPVLALMWYRVADRSGYAEAGLAGTLLQHKMARAQVMRAKLLADQWKRPGTRTVAAQPKAERITTAPRMATVPTPRRTRIAPAERATASAVTRKPASVAGEAARYDGDWAGRSMGSGLCNKWVIPIRLKVSKSSVTGEIDAGHIHCPLVGTIDKAGQARMMGVCMHTSVVVMADLNRPAAQGSFTADALDCSGQFALRRVSR